MNTYYDKCCEHSTQQFREAIFLLQREAQEAKITMIKSDVELGLNFSIIKNAMPLTSCGNANEKRATSQPYDLSRARIPLCTLRVAEAHLRMN